MDGAAPETVTVSGRGPARRVERAGEILLDAAAPALDGGVLAYEEAGRRYRTRLTLLLEDEVMRAYANEESGGLTDAA